MVLIDLDPVIGHEQQGTRRALVVSYESGNYEFQVPIFVLTHHPPALRPKQDEHLTSSR